MTSQAFWMIFLYSILLAIGFLLLTPLFLLRREKYASGFSERLGNYPPFLHDGRSVIWLHCVSVGETNAARPLVDEIRKSFPDHRLVISTTTKTGQDLAKKVFAEKADAVVYFPFDFAFSVRRALQHFKPSLVLLMETEIWPRLIHEAKKRNATIAIVNGRLSERSASRYSTVRPFISNVLAEVDLALMQSAADAGRIASLGMPPERTAITGNIKFDLGLEAADHAMTEAIRKRFALDGTRPLVVAASTHDPEERIVLEAFCSAANGAEPAPRLMIAPRHPQRFDAVAKMVGEFGTDPANEWRRYRIARRSQIESGSDRDADVILLDSIGELRAVYPLADIVFVGGSLIPHGGQSILEPAVAGKAIITGPHTYNFADAVRVFLEDRALVQIPDSAPVDHLFDAFSDLLENKNLRDELGRNALSVMSVNRGATSKTAEQLSRLSGLALKN